MTFSNPASGASDQAARYVAALMDLLGDQDPLEVQRALPEWVNEFLSGVPAELLDQPEADGKWSIADTLRHLAHTETVYAYRYRVVKSQDDPLIPGFDQDAWAEGLKDDPPDLDDAVVFLRYMRMWNVAFLERLDAAALARAGTHSERGTESLAHLIKLGAAHDLVHRAQLERIRDRLSRS